MTLFDTKKMRCWLSLHAERVYVCGKAATRHLADAVEPVRVLKGVMPEEPVGRLLVVTTSPTHKLKPARRPLMNRCRGSNAGLRASASSLALNAIE